MENLTKNQNISFYEENTATLFEQYQSISFENVHQSWLSKLTLSHYQSARDIGAGSGRDALALSDKGLCVTAIEPAKSLMDRGVQLTGDKVRWKRDILPELSTLASETFDLILISAVWMHLTIEQQSQSLKRIRCLLSDNGVLIISIRHGDFKDGRKAFDVNATRLINEANTHGLTLLHTDNDTDQLNRIDVFWETVVFTRKS